MRLASKRHSSRRACSLLMLVAGCQASSPNSGADVSNKGDMRARLQQLPFVATDPPEHTMVVNVGVFFEHLYAINSVHHTFKADFWLVYRWHDPRNFSVLFHNNSLLESNDEVCDNQGHGHRRLNALLPIAGAATNYLEFQDELLDHFWHPDGHIRNRNGGILVHSRLTRLFEDGTFEQMQLVVSDLLLPRPEYGPYPFDRQVLSVQIESMAHTTKQLVFRPLAAFSGLNNDGVHEWPGWRLLPDGVTFGVTDQVPDYVSVHENAHRCERRSRYFLNIAVQRHVGNIVLTELVPLIMQVFITWTAFFIGIGQLMPRVAVAFVSYLSLNNAASALTEGLPPVSYVMFIDVFVLTQRLMVVISLLETVATWFITQYTSTRVGLALDNLARFLVPINYIVFNSILFAVGQDITGDAGAYDTSLHLLQTFAWLNFCFVMLAFAAWGLFKYWRLYRLIMKDPVKLHTLGLRIPLDSNEKSLMFWSFDTNEDGLVGVRHLVIETINRMNRQEMLEGKEEMVAAVLAKIPEKNREANQKDAFLAEEEFLVHYKVIFMTITHLSRQLSSKLSRDSLGIGSEAKTEAATSEWQLVAESI